MRAYVCHRAPKIFFETHISIDIILHKYGERSMRASMANGQNVSEKNAGNVNLSLGYARISKPVRAKKFFWKPHITQDYVV